MTKYAQIFGQGDSAADVRRKPGFLAEIVVDKKALFGLIVLSIFIFFAFFNQALI